MIVLDSTTDIVEVVLNQAITTNQLQCMSSWRDITTSAYTPWRTLINTNSTTDVTIVGSPGASTQRVVDQISIYNRDTVIAGVTVKFSDNGTEYILNKVALAPWERLEYTEKKGWRVTNVLWWIKSTILTETHTNSSSLSCMVLNSDQVINNPTANLYYKIIGFNPMIEQGKIYYINMKLIFSINSTSDGIFFGMNIPISGSSANRIFLRECKPISTTTQTPRIQSWSNTFIWASVSSSASTSANIFDLEWIIGGATNAPEWKVEFYVAPESNSSTITLKKWSVLYYQEVL